MRRLIVVAFVAIAVSAGIFMLAGASFATATSCPKVLSSGLCLSDATHAPESDGPTPGSGENVTVASNGRRPT